MAVRGHGKKRASGNAPSLTHVDSKGEARMVDVSGKPETVREAVARGALIVSREAFEAVRGNRVAKGDVLTVARIAGIQAAKQTSALIPLCHPIPLDHVEVKAVLDAAGCRIELQATARTRSSTGVEMEALTAVTVAGLAAYDMIKAIDRGAVLTEVRLVSKSGGARGAYARAGERS
ncbi:MAG TPA: cyclic pyranopterin monophosphate synthase MoaC [Verrucomicrobiae bacterium]|nr:cyclic pyranopterin monophosphate synthase MoaC [Verrucomicrobiae bacterium]